MILKNKIISLLFLTSTIGISHTLSSMDTFIRRKIKANKEEIKQLQDLHEQKKELEIKIAAQEAINRKKEEHIQQEAGEQKRKNELEETKKYKEQLKEETKILKEAKERKEFLEHQYNESKKAKEEKHKDALDTEQLRQAKETTQTAINNNNAKRQIGIQAVNNFTAGMSKAAGQSISGSVVNAVQHELDYLYSQYRPTQMTLLQEVDAASKIIHQGISNVSEYYDKQHKLILSSQNKDSKIINEALQALKAEVSQAYDDLDAMEKESRNRLAKSYNFRNPNFERTTKEPKRNIFEDQKVSPTHPNENSPAKPQDNGSLKNTSKDIIKNIAGFITAAPLLIADKIVDTLSIDSYVNQINQLEPLKNEWITKHTKKISQFTALSLVIGSLAILYKTYSWYYNQDRITAAETILQLEEQREQVALQFAKEMEKNTLSKEDKQKLQIAYNKYMKDLQEEINEQKSIAGYNISKKLLIGTLIASSGIAGIITYIKYYFNNQQINFFGQNKQISSDQGVLIPTEQNIASLPEQSPEQTQIPLPQVQPEEAKTILPEDQKEDCVNNSVELQIPDNKPENEEEKTVEPEKIVVNRPFRANYN